ncbi:hypothetical protein ACQ5SK_17525 [Bradyrhizobium japonicum]
MLRGSLLAGPISIACTGMQQSACLVLNRSCLGTILPLPIFRLEEAGGALSLMATVFELRRDTACA